MADLKFEKDTLLFGRTRIEPKARTVSEMLPVLYCPEKVKPDSWKDLTYFMYREAARMGNIRYDVTRIRKYDLVCERNKTFGHVHPVSKSGAAWSEVYEVLSGEAHFLLQKATPVGIEDAVLLTAKKGECLLLPPGYGHVTINTGKGELLLANLVSDGFEADYSMFAQRRGGCFYEKLDGELVRNENYGSEFELRKMTAAKFSAQYGCFAPFAKGNLLEAAKRSPCCWVDWLLGRSCVGR